MITINDTKNKWSQNIIIRQKPFGRETYVNLLYFFKLSTLMLRIHVEITLKYSRLKDIFKQGENTCGHTIIFKIELFTVKNSQLNRFRWLYKWSLSTYSNFAANWYVYLIMFYLHLGGGVRLLQQLLLIRSAYIDIVLQLFRTS